MARCLSFGFLVSCPAFSNPATTCKQTLVGLCLLIVLTEMCLFSKNKFLSLLSHQEVAKGTMVTETCQLGRALRTAFEKALEGFAETEVRRHCRSRAFSLLAVDAKPSTRHEYITLDRIKYGPGARPVALTPRCPLESSFRRIGVCGQSCKCSCKGQDPCRERD